MVAGRELIAEVVEHGLTLSETQAHAVVSDILASDQVPDREIAALLTALARRGETAAELAGFVHAMRERMTPLPITEEERAALVDTCGTGGDGCGTFNISTAAALVAAAAGARVAKHGNRAMTSMCGSADVLEALGVPVNLAPEEAVRCLRETGFVFLYAQLAHPAMRRVQPVRRTLPFRTIFNLAGPLSNPAGAPAQVLGVFAADRIALVAETMAALGTRHSFVVHGSDGVDELTITGPSDLAEIRSTRVERAPLSPEDVGLARAPRNVLRGGDTAGENAAILHSIFAGELGPRRDVVLLNASAALVAAGVATDLLTGIAYAGEAIDSGRARQLVRKLQAFTEREGNKAGSPMSVAIKENV